MSEPFAEKLFKSFDGSESFKSKLYCPDRYRLLENVFKQPGTFSMQGAGLSYAPLSFGGNATVQLNNFDRFLSFDQVNGIVEVEAGISLGSLAQITIPKGWYLKVQPGHPSITVGGCVGADVHGKNQFQDLNFKEQVLFLNLYHPDKGFLFCDRSTNSELFHLTCGGWGLSGVIISVGIKLGRLTSCQIETQTLPVVDIFELPSLLKERSFRDDLLYSWHDFNNQKNWGHGFLTVGRHLKPTETASIVLNPDLEILENVHPLYSELRGRLPFNLLTPASVWAMNKIYYRKEINKIAAKRQSIVEFIFPVINKTIYFDLFGRSGFHETQVLIPLDRFEYVMKELKSGLKKFPVPITLASCKLFRGQQELLRFIGEGIVLAINFPRSPESIKLLDWWDKIVVQSGGLPNISKDSRLSLETIESCYPQFLDFRSQLQQWDPKRIFQTSMSKRLRL